MPHSGRTTLTAGAFAGAAATRVHRAGETRRIAIAMLVTLNGGGQRSRISLRRESALSSHSRIASRRDKAMNQGAGRRFAQSKNMLVSEKVAHRPQAVATPVNDLMSSFCNGSRFIMRIRRVEQDERPSIVTVRARHEFSSVRSLFPMCISARAAARPIVFSTSCAITTPTRSIWSATSSTAGSCGRAGTGRSRTTTWCRSCCARRARARA